MFNLVYSIFGPKVFIPNSSYNWVLSLYDDDFVPLFISYFVSWSQGEEQIREYERREVEVGWRISKTRVFSSVDNSIRGNLKIEKFIFDSMSTKLIEELTWLDERAFSQASSSDFCHHTASLQLSSHTVRYQQTMYPPWLVIHSRSSTFNLPWILCTKHQIESQEQHMHDCHRK